MKLLPWLLNKWAPKNKATVVSSLPLMVAVLSFLLLTVALPPSLSILQSPLCGELWSSCLDLAAAAALSNHNRSRACFMSLKDSCSQEAEVPYLLGSYRFLFEAWLLKDEATSLSLPT